MLLFEYDSGHLYAARLGARRSADVDPGVMAAVRDSALEIVGRPSRAFLSPPEGGVETLCRTIEKLTGARPDLATGGGTSDARFIAPYCPVVECGVPGPSMHQVDEHVAVADVEGLTAIYAAFIKEYLR